MPLPQLGLQRDLSARQGFLMEWVLGMGVGGALDEAGLAHQISTLRMWRAERWVPGVTTSFSLLWTCLKFPWLKLGCWGVCLFVCFFMKEPLCGPEMWERLREGPQKFILRKVPKAQTDPIAAYSRIFWVNNLWEEPGVWSQTTTDDKGQTAWLRGFCVANSLGCPFNIHPVFCSCWQDATVFSNMLRRGRPTPWEWIMSVIGLGGQCDPVLASGM